MVVARGLIEGVLGSHLVGLGARGARWGEGAEIEVKPDHVVAGGAAAIVALAAFESLGLPRVRIELALIGAERHAPQAAFESSGELVALQQAARRAGAHFARPGEGRCEIVHLERFASPGRVVATAGHRAPVAGALGMLPLEAGYLEVAAALAGHALDRAWPGVLSVRLRGQLGPWVGAQDVALELLRRLPPGGSAGRLIEYGGEGVAALTVSQRIALAAQSAVLGAPASLFPSDEITRRFLSAQGREADWKRIEADDDPPPESRLELDLEQVEPLIADLDRPEAARAPGAVQGLSVGPVVVGPLATAADLARLARVLGGGRVREEVSLILMPGSRQVTTTAARDGVLEALVRAGARIAEGGLRLSEGPSTRATIGLCFGIHRTDLPPGRARWHVASLESCAAAALAGVPTDPRDLALEDRRDEAPVTFVTGAGVDAPIEAVMSSPEQKGGGWAAFPSGPPLLGPLRGGVLLKLGDRVSTAELLPWGARVRPLVRHIESLADHTLASLDPGFARRAREHGGGFLVAGAAFGTGPVWDTAALVPAALGVRVVIARSIVPGFRRALALAGVLPLQFVAAPDYGAVARGDELEIPGLPHVIEAGRTLVVRNLSRGTQYSVRHDLSPREAARLCAGGLLAVCRAGA